MKYSNAQQVKDAFEAAYAQIHQTRFVGLPITNHQLEVKVVGLRETEEFYTFSLITPWMLNLIAVPKADEMDDRAVGHMRADHLDQLGAFFVTNVISPMTRIKSMEFAIRKGEKLAEELFMQVSGEGGDQPPDESRRKFFQRIVPLD